MGLKMILVISAVFHCQLSAVFGGFINHHPWEDPDYFLEAEQDEFKGKNNIKHKILESLANPKLKVLGNLHTPVTRRWR